MALFLLFVIFLSYIALGVPDSLFGAAWPAMYESFSLPFSFGGAISLVCSVCTFCSSLAAGRLLARFGTWRVTLVSALFTAAALFAIAFCSVFWAVLLFCIPLGLGAGAIDTGLNGYVALHYSERQMNFLHCFYGVGVLLSPIFISLALGTSGDYRTGFVSVSLLLFAISLVLFFSRPLWERKTEDGERRREFLTLRQMVRIPHVKTFWVLFFSSCALEFVCGTWGATFLVEAKQLSASRAAGFVALYYLGITLGRFCAGLLAKKYTPVRLICLSQTVLALSVFALFFAKSGLVSSLLLFLIGFGNGPIYPSLMNLVTPLFGESRTESLMGSFLAAACLGITLAPPIFGILSGRFGLLLFAPFLALCVALFWVEGLRFLKRRGNGKDCT